MIAKIVRFAIRYRFSLITVIFSITAFSAIEFYKNLNNSDNGLPVWFEKSDPIYQEYQSFLKTFGNDRFVLLGFDLPDVFSEEGLRFIKTISEALKNLPIIERVESITNVQDMHGTEDEILIQPLVGQVPHDAQELQKLKEKALADPDYINNLVTLDGKTVGIWAKINVANTVAGNLLVRKTVREMIQKLNTAHYPSYLAGSPITDAAFNELAVGDQLFFIVAMPIVMILMLFIFFRSFLVAVIPTLMQSVVILWTLALYYKCGLKLNIVSGMLVTVLMAVCIADSVHMILEYYRNRNEGLHRNEALVQASSSLWRPCLYTALTTLAGFISFQSSQIPPINHMGVFSAIGVAIAFLLTIFFIPVLLSLFPEPKKEITLHVNNKFVSNLLERVFQLTVSHPKKIGSIFAVTLVIAGIGFLNLKVETNLLEYFPESGRERQDLEFFNKKLAGVGVYDVVLKSKGHSIANDPQVLKAIESFRKEAMAQPLSTAFYSHVSYIKKINQAFHNNDPSYAVIPDGRNEVSQLLFLAASSGETEIDQYKTPDDSQIRISMRTNSMKSEEMGKYLAGIKNIAHQKFDPLGVDILITGYVPLWVKLDLDILKSQIISFCVAFVAVALMMIFFLKSWKVGLISMIPNVVPIFYTMGIMGFTGVHLNVSTVLIAGVTVGITVDDTIHYLTRFKELFHQTKDYTKAIQDSNASVGAAIIFTTTVLTLGFGMMVFGSFMPSIYFGGMSAVTLFISVICEIFMMPLLLLWLKPFKA